MTDEIEDPTPPVIDYVDYAKSQAQERLIVFLNGVTYAGLNRYPQAEVQSWTIQKDEAEALLGAGEDATLALAPFLTMVCVSQFGEVDEATRLQQVHDKAVAVKANADAWAQLGAAVNGLRARAQLLIEAATTQEEVIDIMQSVFNEGDAIRAAAGF